MADREKVVGHLYDCLLASKLENMWVFVRKDIIGDALAMLKEQPEIVRCKDCKYSGHCDTEDLHRCTDQDDWFCADGERRC